MPKISTLCQNVGPWILILNHSAKELVECINWGNEVKRKIIKKGGKKENHDEISKGQANWKRQPHKQYRN